MKRTSEYTESIFLVNIPQDWRLRSNAMCTIEEMLKSTENLSLVQPCLESLLRTLLSSEKHPDVIEDKRRILINLISRLPLDNLEDRATQILIGICRQGGAGSNRVAKALMQRLPPTAVVIKLISDDFLKSHSSKVHQRKSIDLSRNRIFYYLSCEFQSFWYTS